MTENEARILRQALSLPPEGRAALAGSLLDSLESPPDPDAEVAWATEIAKRAREIDDGAPLVPWVAELDDAMARVQESPNTWLTFVEGTRRHALRRFPYFVVYRSSPGRVEVPGVAHARR